MEQFIHQNGYITVLIGIAVAGEVGLFTGIALARIGSVSIPGVVLLGTAASFVANMFYFYVGKLMWNRWEFLRHHLGKKLESSSGLIVRHGAPIMLLARFLYGIRDAIPIALGVYDVGQGSFAVYNLAGAFLWAFSFTVLGDAFSDFVLRTVRSIELGILLASAALAAAGMCYVFIRKRTSRLRS